MVFKETLRSLYLVIQNLLMDPSIFDKYIILFV